MDSKRQIVRHFLAALAYRTEKALRDAPESFPDFRAMDNVRTPHELLWHMTGVLGYARTFFVGGVWQPERISFSDEVRRFHELLQDLDQHLEAKTALNGISLEQLLQGPLSDAMTHAGQLAMLRRFAGSPVPSENFVFADIRTGNLGTEQSLSVAPDLDWTPDRPPHAPGRRRAT
jgi:hypothetical protein